VTFKALIAAWLACAVPMLAGASPVQTVQDRPLPDTLSPEARVAMAAIAAQKTPDQPPSLTEMRKLTDAVQASFGAKLEKRYGVRMEMTVIAGVPVRIVYPKGMTALGKGPVLLNLHGGGFALDSGSLTETIPVAARSGLPVVAVLYRLSPENPYPAALDDAFAVYQALEKNRPSSRIAVFGTSAGATLSGQLIARLASQGRPMPAALGYFSGKADASQTGDTESSIPAPAFDWLGVYAGKTPITDPIFSPLRGDVSHFPPTLLLTSTRDILLSPTSIFARALSERGVDVQLVVFDGLPHAFWSYMDIPESDQANALIARFLKAKLMPSHRRSVI
jgi:acetyl esterase/lipase